MIDEKLINEHISKQTQYKLEEVIQAQKEKYDSDKYYFDEIMQS